MSTPRLQSSWTIVTRCARTPRRRLPVRPLTAFAAAEPCLHLSHPNRILESRRPFAHTTPKSYRQAPADPAADMAPKAPKIDIK